MENKTGVSMGGSLINAKRPGLIPCNCLKCHHKRKYKDGKGIYCDYYKTSIDKNKKRCARYYGPKIESASQKSTSKTKNSASGKTCKKCSHYDLGARHCNSFSIDIGSTSTGKYCKNYNEARKSIPKGSKYKHSSSKTKWNKYKTKK